MPDSTPIVSTGRGGQGNIGHDPTTYTDGGIIREGIQGESVDGEYSTGRGGGGNMVSPKVGPKTGRRNSQDIIPEADLREAQDNFHTGRGGGGNVYKEKYGGHSHAPKKEGEGIVEKIKQVLHKDGKKGGPAS